MSFNLYIKKDHKTGFLEHIDFSGCWSGLNSDRNSIPEMFEYNDLFSKIIAQNYKVKKYLISPTLTRIEGQSLFYDKLFKFGYLVKIIEKSTKNLMIENIDYLIFEAVLGYLRDKRIKHGYSVFKRGIGGFVDRIKFILRLAMNLSRELSLLLFSKLFIKPAQHKTYDYTIISFYDYRSNIKGHYQDHYFSSLLDYLVKNQKTAIVFNNLLNKNKLAAFKYIWDISKMKDNPEVKLTYQYLSIPDILKAFFSGLKSRINIKENIVFKGLNITYLTNLSLRDEYRKCTWFFPLIQEQFFKKMFKTFSFSRILYPYENHSWEKLLVTIRNEIKAVTKLVAFQHTSFSFKLINHFPGKYEKGIPIFPDKILTVGSILKSMMEEFGNYPVGVIEEGCALRHEYLFKDSISLSRPREFSKKIAYAFSFDTVNYEAILNNLILVFKDSPYFIYLKLHPLVARSFVFKSKMPENFIIANNIEWQQLFNFIDMLLYDDNSLGIEALRYNVEPVYFPFTNQIYNTDRLFKYTQKKIQAESGSLQNFRDSIDRYYENYNKECLGLDRKETQNKAYLYSYFSPITEERLQRFLW